MRLAYIGYDLNSLKAQAALGRHFSDVTFFLVEQNRPVIPVAFENIALLVDGVTVPSENEFRTMKHKSVFKKIKAQYEQFETELFGGVKAFMQPLTSPKSNFKIESFSDVGDLFFDAKKSKVHLERKSQGTDEFDFLMIENHQMISDTLMHFKNSPLSGKTTHSHAWFSVQFSYELKSPRNGTIDSLQLMLINNSKNESLIDNWYFCHLDQGSITIQQWVPFSQYAHLDYQKFMIARTKEVVEKKLDFIHLLELKDQYVDSTSGFSQSEAGLKNARLSAMAPSFAFWSAEKIESYVREALDMKIKKIIKLEMSRGAV